MDKIFYLSPVNAQASKATSQSNCSDNYLNKRKELIKLIKSLTKKRKELELELGIKNKSQRKNKTLKIRTNMGLRKRLKRYDPSIKEIKYIELGDYIERCTKRLNEIKLELINERG